MTRNHNRAILALPAVLTVCMVLVAAVLAKSGCSFLATGGVAGLQIVYPAAAYAAKHVLRF
jgi:hypothetical protein